MSKSACQILSLILCFVSLTAVAAGQTEDEKIEHLDLDKDGKIAIREAVADPKLLASFGRIDTDGDGLISRLELEQAKYAETSLQAQIKAKNIE